MFSGRALAWSAWCPLLQFFVTILSPSCLGPESIFCFKTPDHSKFPKELREASTNSATPGAISQQNVFPREETEHSTYNKIARAELVVRLIYFWKCCCSCCHPTNCSREVPRHRPACGCRDSLSSTSTFTTHCGLQ